MLTGTRWHKNRILIIKIRQHKIAAHDSKKFLFLTIVFQKVGDAPLFKRSIHWKKLVSVLKQEIQIDDRIDTEGARTHSYSHSFIVGFYIFFV